MAETVSRGDVIAFRLNAHGLVERRAEDGRLEAAGRCGVHNSPPGSALLALRARVLTEVEFGGQAWILAEDREALRSSPMPKGVRLLPPRDPYTQLRDRETIVDEKHHDVVWMPSGDPGTVMINGKITGTWRPRTSGRKLTMIIDTLDLLRSGDKESVKEEAELVAPLRGASSATVDFDSSSGGDR